MKYIPEVCSHCGQSMTYLITIDQGAIDTLIAMSVAVSKKGINVIHPRKEMEIEKINNYREMIKSGKITSNMTGNLPKARFHGLIAKIKGEAGNYCITKKGLHFLRGGIIPKHAIVSKVYKSNIGYYKPEEENVSVTEFLEEKSYYWEGINFDIIDGRIINGVPIEKVEIENSVNLKLVL
jgi:hypothetical protein